jgi:uncharacterized OsmC-like protein
MQSKLMPMLANNNEAALRARYRLAPESAWATHLAWTESSGAEVADPYRGMARMGLAGHELPFALDDAVGGPHDEPAPGELLCAALAACLDSTIRLVAVRHGIVILGLAVIVTGDVDARGTLGDRDVPVGFQSLRVEIQLKVADGTPSAAADRLLDIAARHCEMLQTLRTGVPIEILTGDPE